VYGGGRRCGQPPLPAAAIIATPLPKSHEGGTLNLPVPLDEIWDSFTPLQRFLWYADEMEHHWYTLRQQRNISTGNDAAPAFYEMTGRHRANLPLILPHCFVIWAVRQIINASSSMILPKAKQHVRHSPKSRNCAEFTQQDLEYRRKMQYNRTVLDILFHHRYPECRATRDELLQYIQLYSGGGEDDNNATNDASTDWSARVLPAP